MSQAPFEFRLRVRYAECDAQHVVFNARYGDYVDIAINEYIRTLFGSYQQMLDLGLDMQVVALNQSWQAPARYDDVLCARVEPGRVGNTSFTVNVTFYRYGDDTRLMNAEVVYVIIDPATMAKKLIPVPVRALLEQGAPGVMISHAGESPVS